MKRTKKTKIIPIEQLRRIYAHLYNYIYNNLGSFQDRYTAADDVLRYISDISFDNRFKPFDLWAYSAADEKIKTLDSKDYYL